jgi:hypothetical protein
VEPFARLAFIAVVIDTVITVIIKIINYLVNTPIDMINDLVIIHIFDFNSKLAITSKVKPTFFLIKIINVVKINQVINPINNLLINSLLLFSRLIHLSQFKFKFSPFFYLLHHKLI